MSSVNHKNPVGPGLEIVNERYLELFTLNVKGTGLQTPNRQTSDTNWSEFAKQQVWGNSPPLDLSRFRTGHKFRGW